MSGILIDLNVILRDVDQYTDRACVKFASRLLRSGNAVVKANDYSDWDSAVDDFTKSLTHAMSNAHSLAADLVQLQYRRYKASHVKLALLQNVPKFMREAVSDLYGSIADSATKKTMTHVRDTLLTSAKSGASVKSALKKAGISTGKASRSALLTTVTRTQTSLAFNSSTWASAVASDSLWGFELTTAGDARVRASHVEMDGVRYPRDHTFWLKYAPPNGWNCRCGLRPIWEGEADAYTVPYRGVPKVERTFWFNPGIVAAAV